MVDPTRTHTPGPDPNPGADPVAETRETPLPPEPVTASALTHSRGDEPPTVSEPRNGIPAEPFYPPPGFEIVRELGRGGMGVVYEAVQRTLGRRVALKVLAHRRSDARDLLRFRAEAEAVAAVRHPNIVQVYEVDEFDGRPFIVLELLTGGSLAERIRARPLDPRAAAELVAQLADAVRAMHELGIVHRDLKPGNVLFEIADSMPGGGSGAGSAPDSAIRNPQSAIPKITDFGLAKRAGGVDLTRTQAVMGTPAYMAPEQARGETKFVGPAADVWALGVILFECLTGKRPFDADDTWAVLRKVTDEAPPAPRSFAPGVPRDLELICLKCLEKNPADRYPGAAALAADLGNYLAGRPVSVRPAGMRERAVKWCRRNPVVAAFSAALLVVALAGFAGVTWSYLRAEERGRQLTRTNTDLESANADLKIARDEQAALTEGLKAARDDLARRASELATANDKSDERGYLSDVGLAHQLWKANDLRGMRKALDRCPPARRRWEWHYLNGLARPERDVIHTSAISLALAYSPDGKYLAHLTFAGELSVRDTATGTEVYSFKAAGPRTTNAQSLAFRADVKELAFSIGGRVWVLDLGTGKATEVEMKKGLNAAQLLPIALGYAADGTLLAVATTQPGPNRPRRYTIFEARAGKVLATLEGEEYVRDGSISDVGGAAFSPDGTWFAAATADTGIYVTSKGADEKVQFHRPELRVWDIATQKLLRREEVPAAIWGAVAFSPDGKLVGCANGCWEVEPVPGRGAVVRAPTGVYRGAAIDRNGIFWFGGTDKLVYGLDVKTGAERFAVRGSLNTVLRVAVSPDGKEFAVATGDVTGGGGAVYRFDVAAQDDRAWRAAVSRDRPSGVIAMAPDGARFAACDFALGERKVSMFVRGVAGGSPVPIATTGTFSPGVFAPDGGLYVWEDKQTLRRFGPDGAKGRAFALPKRNHNGLEPIPAACLSPDGRVLAAVDCSAPPRDLKKPAGPVLITAHLDTWDAASGAPGKSAEVAFPNLLPPGARRGSLLPMGAAFDPAGARLAAAFTAAWEAADESRIDYRGVVVVWDVKTGAELFRQITLDPMRAVAFAPDGTVVSAGGSPLGGVVYGWDVGTSLRRFALTGHGGPILSLAFGPNGRLATGGEDRAVKLWDLGTRREVLTLDGFGREVTHLVFSPDGKNLVAGTGIDPLLIVTMQGIPTEFPPAEVRVFRGQR